MPTHSKTPEAPGVNLGSEIHSPGKDVDHQKESPFLPRERNETDMTIVSPTDAVPGEAIRTADSATRTNFTTNTFLPESSFQAVTEEGSSQDIPTLMESSSINTTGLDVDSNSIERDSEDGDSAIGASVYSSTYSTRSTIYDFVEENGRTYHRFKEGKYHLPNDEVSTQSCHSLILLTHFIPG
jgi:hypothetical protein